MRREEDLEEPLLAFAESSTIPDINPVLTSITENLRSKLTFVGINDSWIVRQANIYERAFLELSKILEKPYLDEHLKSRAQAELFDTAQFLDNLFSGQIKLRLTNETLNTNDIEGYLNTDDGSIIRANIFQKFQDGYSQNVHRITVATCQIGFYEILGRSPRGKALAGADAQTRIGLRHTHNPEADIHNWSISIDSGYRSGGGEKSFRWRAIYPISQAIHAAKIVGEDLSLSDSTYTFHYDQPEMRLIQCSPVAIKNWLYNYSSFNLGLNAVFRLFTR